MAWTAPSNPVSGTVITVSYAVANILDPLRWLRLMAGNADPPGTSYVVVSDSVAGTSWKKVPADALASGAVVTHLGYTPASRFGDNFTGACSITTNGAVPALTLTQQAAAGPSLRIAGGAGFDVVVDHAAVTLNVPLQENGSISATGNVAAGGNVTASGTVGAGVFNGGTTASGTVSAARVAAGASGIDTVGRVTAAELNGGTTAVGTVAAARLAAGASGVDTSGQIQTTIPTGSQPLLVASQTRVANLNADMVDGAHATATPTGSSIPIADAAGKLDAWVSPSGLAGVPSGVICGFAGGAAAIPTGWTRYAAADGRLLVGAGTFAGSEQTFTENNTYGSTWAHLHASNSFGFSVNLSGGSALSVTASGSLPANTGGPSATNGLAAPGGTNLPTDSHTHSLGGSVTVGGSATGTVAGSAAGNTTSTTLLLPMRAIVWIVKS